MLVRPWLHSAELFRPVLRDGQRWEPSEFVLLSVCQTSTSPNDVAVDALGIIVERAISCLNYFKA